MRTKLFLGLAAIALMTSCSNNETIDMIQPNTIGFENAFVNNSSRAGDVTNSNFASFALYGFVKDATGVLFNNEKVSKNADTWSYSNIQYWTPGVNHWFTGIAPYDNKNWSFAPETNTNTVYKGGGTLTFNNESAKGEEDLIYAFSGAKSIGHGVTTTAPVELTFNHLLSRVKFSFKNTDTNSNITFQVTDVKITNAIAEGEINMNVETPNWEKAKGKFITLFGDAKKDNINIIPINETHSTDHKYLIPVSYLTEYKATFKAEMRSGEVITATKVFEINIHNLLMTKGFSYNLIAELNGATMGGLEIEFTANVDDWQDSTNAPNYNY